jgi:integrase/recombinase XerD
MGVIGRLKLMNNEDLIEMYLEKLSDSEKSKTLCESILNDLNTFKEFILEKKFIDVDREILIKFVEYLKDNFSNNTVIKKLNSCRAFFSYLNEKGFINENILKEIKNLKKSFSIPEVLTYEELEILLGSCETNDKGLRDKLVISLMVATGMQLNKVLELETSSVDENIIIFEKNNKKYIIKVEENLRNIIASYKNSKICGKNKLFEGLSRQNFFARIKKCQEKAGIKKKINPAMLRNTSLFNFIEEGVSVKELKEKLDYVNIGSTGIYKVRNKSDIKRIYEKIGIGDWDVSEFN